MAPPKATSSLHPASSQCFACGCAVLTGPVLLNAACVVLSVVGTVMMWLYGKPPAATVASSALVRMLQVGRAGFVNKSM